MIPQDAREVYCDADGEPIAYCPKDGLGVTDLHRVQFYEMNKDRLAQMAVRAKQKDSLDPDGAPWGVVCIDVDDPVWSWLVDLLMPGHDWQAFRNRNEKPVARGVVPIGLLRDAVAECYPASSGEFRTDQVNIVVCAAGGASVFRERAT